MGWWVRLQFTWPFQRLKVEWQPPKPGRFNKGHCWDQPTDGPRNPPNLRLFASAVNLLIHEVPGVFFHRVEKLLKVGWWFLENRWLKNAYFLISNQLDFWGVPFLGTTPRMEPENTGEPWKENSIRTKASFLRSMSILLPFLAHALPTSPCKIWCFFVFLLPPTGENIAIMKK